MKFGVHILFFNQDKWILKTIENCGPYVDRIYVAWSKTPWGYNKNSTVVNESNVEFLKQSPYYDKITVIQGEWELDEDERNSCLEQAKSDGMDYLITQDADEFYTFSGYQSIIDGIRQNPNYDYYTTPWYVFWKDQAHIIERENGDRIAGYPEVAINLSVPDIHFVRCRRPNSTYHKRLDALCYHMCFVFDTDQDCWNKINSWSHSHQFDTQRWYDNYWLKWTPELRHLHPIHPTEWYKAVVYTGELPEVLRG